MVSDPAMPQTLRQVDDTEIHQSIRDYFADAGIQYWGSIGSQFLGNAARFYADVGQRREYATPEDDSFIGTTANEIASEHIMQGVADWYEVKTGNKLQYIKRVIDDEATGAGYHASFSAVNTAFEDKEMWHIVSEEKMALFGVYAATRGVLFGSGVLLPSSSFAIAQKSLSLTCDFSNGTTTNKPLVNLRNERHASKEFIRIHDTSGDATMSPWATRVKLGSASIILRLIEHGYTLEDQRFKQPIHRVATSVAWDTDLNKRFKLMNGEGVTALDMQSKLVAAARNLCKDQTIELSKEELWTLDEWERAIADLRQNPRLTADRIEWVMRREVLKRLHERHGWSWHSQILRYKDRQFSDISANGIAKALRETAWASYMPGESTIRDRIYNPPQTTRAKLRGDFIKRIVQKGEGNCLVAWDQLKYNEDNFPLQNPYVSRNTRLDNLLKSA